jgi:hypothetical protein
MIFQDQDDLQAALAALRENIEDLPRRGVEPAQAILDRLAGKFRAELAGVILFPLESPSDCMSCTLHHRGDALTLAFLKALASVLETKASLHRLTGAEALEELHPLFAEVLSLQARSERFTCRAKAGRLRPLAVRARRHRLAREIEGIFLAILETAQDSSAKDLLARFRNGPGTFSNGEVEQAFAVQVQAGDAEDVLAAIEAETDEILCFVTAHALDAKLSKARKS